MKCPKCNKSIFPFKLILHTRWSPLTCTECRTKLKRSINIQLGLMSIFVVVGITFIGKLEISKGFQLLIVLFWLVAIALIDAFTVDLKPLVKDNETI